jgi:hypothetical protein
MFWGRPDDLFTGMTLRDFDLAVRGYNDRMYDERYLLAWHAANLMGCWVKRPPSPAKLMGEDRNATKSLDELRGAPRKRK